MAGSRNSAARKLPWRYRFERELGRGSAGRVVQALDRRARRRVAIKILDRDSANTEALFRFVREQGLRLDHPNVVAVHDYLHRADGPMIVMELVEGGNLAERLRAGFDLRPEQQRQFLAEMLTAVGFIHGHGIIHRDIKPSNIFVSDGKSGPHPKVGDFGAALALDQPRLTTYGHQIGTVGYMAPEVSATGEADERSDLYGLGMVVKEMLAAASRPDPVVSELGRQLTATSPEDRPQSTSAALGQLFASTPDLADRLVGSAGELRARQPVAPQARRAGRGLLAGGAFAVVAIGGVAAYAAASGTDEVATTTTTTTTSTTSGTTAHKQASTTTVRPTTTTTTTVLLTMADITLDGSDYSCQATHSGIDSSSGSTFYDATNVIDGNPETAWRCDEPLWKDQWIRLDLKRRRYVSEVRFIPGYTKIDKTTGIDNFKQNRQIKEIKFVYDDYASDDAKFPPKPDYVSQRVGRTTRFITLVIKDSDPGQSFGSGRPARDDAPISEIQVVVGS